MNFFNLKECRQEIQSSLVSLNEAQPGLGTTASSSGRRPNSSPSQDRGSVATDSGGDMDSGMHPGIWIGLFVSILFSVVVAYIIYANKVLAEAYPEKNAKKLGKKKVSYYFLLIGVYLQLY